MMDSNSLPIIQLPLFVYGEAVTNIVELFPAVWKSAESLTSKDIQVRLQGLNILVEMSAQKISPLIAYMISTCINDPDVNFRKRVAFILGDLISGDSKGLQVQEDVRSVVINYLHNMNQASVYGLLEVSVTDDQTDESLYHLFNACPNAGKYMGDILSDWRNPQLIRRKAIYFVGLVGYVEALPGLERLYNRLEARQNGQFLMDFAPPSIKSDNELLPHLRIAIDRLRAR